MAAVNSAFVGDDGKVMVIDVLAPVTSPITPTSVKQDIDYSTAAKRPQIAAALAGKNALQGLCISLLIPLKTIIAYRY